MDFDLSDEQQEFQGAARALLESLSLQSAEREPQEALRGGWDAITAQGWLRVLVPEKLGGLGLTWVEACVLIEQLGTFASPLPVGPTVLAVDAAVHADETRAVDVLLDGSSSALVVSTA